MKKWKIDPAHSEVAFKAKHLMISTVRGVFSKFEGEMTAEDDTLNNSTINFSVDINSLETKNKDRDAHLLSADFFDMNRFPKMTFASTSVERIENELKIIGDLTIKGTTKSVELKANINGTHQGMEGEKVTGFELVGKINRQNFGLTWNVVLETGGVLVSDDIDIEVFIEAKEE